MKIRCPFICAPSMRDAMPEAVIASARIVPGVTPKPFVVHPEIRHRAARLTPPAIATQDLPPQALRTTSGPAASAAGFLSRRTHDAFSLRPSRNACLCSWGRNLKNLVIENTSISGSP
jgi:hypothetical protein